MKKSTQSVISSRQKGLHAYITDGKLIIDGVFCLFDGDTPYNSFQINVQMDGSFPNSEPRVLETGNKIIPKSPVRHINGDGTCCIGIWEEWLYREEDHSAANFLNTILYTYFTQQDYYERKGIWPPTGERSHGEKGMLESYGDILGIKPQKRKILAYLGILGGAWPKGHCSCPCRSGKILRNCHKTDFWDLHKKVPSKLAKQMRKRLLSMPKIT